MFTQSFYIKTLKTYFDSCGIIIKEYVHQMILYMMYMLPDDDDDATRIKICRILQF
jgi:hypothetical protein